MREPGTAVLLQTPPRPSRPPLRSLPGFTVLTSPALFASGVSPPMSATSEEPVSKEESRGWYSVRRYRASHTWDTIVRQNFKSPDQRVLGLRDFKNATRDVVADGVIHPISSSRCFLRDFEREFLNRRLI